MSIRILFTIVMVCLTGTASVAQSDAQDARVIPEQSSISQNWAGQTILHLSLTRGMPFRVFTLSDPARLVIDFRDLSVEGLRDQDLLTERSGVSDIGFDIFQPGWVRLVATMTRPMLPQNIGLALDDQTGLAVLTVELEPAEQQDFAAASGVPQDALWPSEPSDDGAVDSERSGFVVVIDPGHGGIDPGAEREGISEKEIMLDVANELRTALQSRADVTVYLTREDDRFISLDRRVAFAHQRNADLFLSLHADALSEGGAKGATVYTLSDEASDAASAQLAARHNRTDLIAGVDLTDADDEVAGVLLDLVRQETAPRAAALARSLVKSMSDAGGPVNSRPLRQAGFSVLKSADIPSVLVELGFLSNARDLENIRDPAWRSHIIGAMAQAIIRWHDQDAVRRDQIRQ